MEYITKLLVDYGLETRTAGYLANVIMILLITGLSMVANFITKKSY